LFFVKQVAKDLGITPQAIYKQKEELIDKGYMIKTTTNDWEITAEGYNYLKEKQINRFKRKQVDLNEDESKNTENSANSEFFSLNETLKNFYETRLEEIKQSYENQLKEKNQQVEYFKTLYEEEKSERIKTAAQYQTYLLGTAEDNKKHWWHFWNKSNKES
jgi:predicted ArsR family transcriptional regulator